MRQVNGRSLRHEHYGNRMFITATELTFTEISAVQKFLHDFLKLNFNIVLP